MGNRRKSRAAAVLTLALSATLLCGCSLIGDGGTVIGFLGEDAANADRMRTLADDVSQLGGVITAEGIFDAAGTTPGPTLAVTAAESITEDQLIAIVIRAGDDYAGEWTEYVGSLAIELGQTSTLTVTDFTRPTPELQADVAYWRDVEEVVGAPFSLTLGGGVGGAPVSQLMAEQTDVEATRLLVENYDDVLALDPESTRYILSPAFTVGEGLPPSAVVDVYRRILDEYAILDRASSAPEGAEFAWSTKADGARVVRFSIADDSIEFDADGSGNPSWHRAVEAAQLVATAGVEHSSLTLLRGETSIGFHLGECADEGVPDAASVDLVSALQAAGVDLPGDAGPAYCERWAD